MDDDWWPDLLAHISAEDPWAESDVLVAEIRSHDDPWIPGSRVLWSALVPTPEFEALDGQLIAFNYEVESTGRPGPGRNVAGSVNPRFWIGAYADDRRIECEPLILGWENNNHSAMVLDPKFAMTYGLVPRALSDGSVHWDNPAEPEFDVARVSAPSVYVDLRQSGARATVSRDYLQDYLSLRGMELVQVYWESRHGPVDAAADTLLGDRQQVNEKLRSREMDVRRRREGGFFAQVWGARHVARPGPLPITNNPLEEAGLSWPGIDVPVTMTVAQRLRPLDHVYVRDTVLGIYEGRPDFHVGAEDGHISYSNQWSTGPTMRLGRDAIQLEVRKLYEGTPARVVQHFHDHAIMPSPELLSVQSRQARNIGVRAKELVYGIADIGLMLCGLAGMFGLDAVGTEAYVGLDRAWLTPNGWWNAAHVEPIRRHIPVDLSRADFLTRCLDLDKLLVEPLAERQLRPLVLAFGTPSDKITDFRGLKLLDRLICLCNVAIDAGLVPWQSGAEIIARYAEHGSKPARPLIKLFALSDLRQAAGHRKDPDIVIPSALERFGLDPSAARGGWGLVLDEVYDQLSVQLAEIHATLVGVLKIPGG
ncbi:MAG: hypothetical protein ABS86_01430 [Sphingobium sp. SCN 64-10]|nr:MAG: hypothetical protein ABS86_01430 [Sphingobium sp. SCN 64-10]